MKKALNTTLTIIMSGLAVFVNGCDGVWQTESLRDQEQSSSQPKLLKVAILNDSFSWNSDHAGFERDLISKFAQDHNYRLQWQVYYSKKDTLTAIKTGVADIAAARFNLPSTAQVPQVLLGPSYERTSKTIICPKVREENVSFFKKIFTLKFGKQVPNKFLIKQFSERPALDQLREINIERDSCVVINIREAQFLIRFFPRLEFIHDVADDSAFRFLLGANHFQLKQEMNTWAHAQRKIGFFDHTQDLYYAHLTEINALDSYMFLKKIKEDLKKLEPQFKTVAKEFKLPWTLIAAIAYQESHWDNDSESFTGVKGIMMLTEETAAYMGVEDRTDLMQSLWGGAKYFRYLLDQQPKDLSSRRRLALALAAYNVGPAHLEDAQDLADHFGRDPWSWKDLKEVLPLLSKSDYFQFLKYGDARGEEPIAFTNRVLNYYEILRYMDDYKKLFRNQTSYKKAKI